MDVVGLRKDIAMSRALEFRSGLGSGCFVLPLGSYMRPQVTIDTKYVLMNQVLYDDDSIYAAILLTSVSGFD